MIMLIDTGYLCVMSNSEKEFPDSQTTNEAAWMKPCISLTFDYLDLRRIGADFQETAALPHNLAIIFQRHSGFMLGIQHLTNPNQ